MQEFSTPYVGLDVHKESIDMALANGPRQAEVRHLGTVAGGVEAVSKAMCKLVSAGRVLHIVYEAGPCRPGHSADAPRSRGMQSK